jgi:hypothetical protein
MPLDSVSSAIVSSIIASAVQGVLAPPPAPPAVGIVRALPIESKMGVMNPPWDGQVMINSRIFFLSPAAVIRNDLNMVVPPMMVQGPVKVRYTTDTAGTVNRVWILSAAESYLPENNN